MPTPIGISFNKTKGEEQPSKDTNKKCCWTCYRWDLGYCRVTASPKDKTDMCSDFTAWPYR